VQLYRYFVSQSSEFCRHNPLCCFSTSNTKDKCAFRLLLSPETFGYTLVFFWFVFKSEILGVCFVISYQFFELLNKCFLLSLNLNF